MLKELTLSRDHFADDPFLLQVFDDIAQLVYIGKEIRKQGATFKNAKLITSDIKADVIGTLEGLEEVVGELLPLFFSLKKSEKKKGKMLGEIRKQNTVLLELASSLAGRLSEVEKQHYEGTGASGNAFRNVQYRLDVIRQAWSAE
jgi:hypothetical protein